MIAPSGSMLPVSPLPTGRCGWTASPSTTVCSLADWDLEMNLLPLTGRGLVPAYRWDLGADSQFSPRRGYA